MAGHEVKQPAAGDRMPAVTLPTADGDVALRRHGRDALVLVVLHGGCDACARYASALAAAAGELREWDARLVLVTTGAAADTAAAPEHAVRASDPAGVLAEHGFTAPSITVADQWGEVHAAVAAGEAHGFLAPEDVVEWVRHLAMRCPECEGEAL